MRVGIDFRILVVGPDLITRGMGRYTQQQLREVLAVDGDNEYVLACNRGNDVSLVAPEIIAAPNVQIEFYSPPGDLPWHVEHPDALLRVAEHYQDWIYRQGFDVWHSTTPFLRQPPFLVSFDACPVVTTFYDLIPLLFAEQYLDGSPLRDHYFRTLELIKGATRLLAISDAAGRDAAQHLGIPAERIDRAWPMPDAVFRPLPDHLLRKLGIAMASRLRLPERYVLTVTDPHHSKNLGTLLHGYAQLPASLRTELPLVVCCHLSHEGRATVRALAEEVGIEDDIVTTGVVSDEELCVLYNRATMLVHPSRYEGFGLPIAEAMACGAPVVTTDVSSMPEVAGDAAIQVQPDDAEGFARAIAMLACDPSVREGLRQAGFEQVQRFNGSQLAEATLASYARAAQPAPPGEGRLRLAIWTPLPPLQTGIADYSVDLLDGLRPSCDVEVFVDEGFLPPDDLLARQRIHHCSAFNRRDAQAPFDAVIFQVGGSLYHHYMSDAVADRPGIVVLHDLMWSHVLYTWWHDRSDPAGFHRQVADLEGPAALDELLAIDPADPEALWGFLRRHPMLEPLIGQSLAQVVHLEAAARELRAAYPGSNPSVIPMGVPDPFDGDVSTSPRLARCALGMPPDTFVVGVYGIVHPSKRLETCVRAFAEMAAARPDARLLIVGTALDERYLGDLHRLADRLGVASLVRFTGHVDPGDLGAYVKAADVILNLRTPLSTHMSATLMRALAAGRPVVISDLPEWDFIPAAACLRVPQDAAEVASLAAGLIALAADPDQRQRMSAAARAFYEEEGTIQHMAERYIELVERFLPVEGPAVGVLQMADEP